MSRWWVPGLAALLTVFLATAALAQQVEPQPGPATAGLPAAPPPDEPPPGALQASAPAAQAPGRVPIAKRWWFWAGLGAAAVGVVALAIALSPREPYEGNTSPGITSPF
jgi:hypothetical protein